MDLSQLANELQGVFDAIAEQRAAEITIFAASQLSMSIQERIFDSGKDSGDSGIANSYSTKPMYANREQVGGGFKPIGKGFKTESSIKKGKSGVEKLRITIKSKGGKSPRKDTKKDRKTMYLSQGYKQLRQLKGRQVGFVDLRLTGSLRASFRTFQQGDKAIVAILSPKEVGKADGLEERYGKKIFTPSKEDEQVANDAIAERVAKIFSELLK